MKCIPWYTKRLCYVYFCTPTFHVVLICTPKIHILCTFVHLNLYSVHLCIPKFNVMYTFVHLNLSAQKCTTFILGPIV